MQSSERMHNYGYSYLRKYVSDSFKILLLHNQMQTWQNIKPFNASQINGIQYSSICVFYLNLNCYHNDENTSLPENIFTIDFLGIRQTAHVSR